MLHIFLSSLLPGQGRPPLAGGGTSHRRARICVPWPQDTSHGVHTDQTFHTPSTGRFVMETYSYDLVVCSIYM